jgi:hypothetical protein
MIVGIITMVLFYMGTGIKRGVQSLIKITADQVGNQQNSDQDFNDTVSGYMEASNSSEQEIKNKQVTEIGYISNITNSAVYVGSTSYNDYSDSITSSITNGGV